ncbi:MAG: hypothetical protein KatS3mg124_0516 [Porticoccaceae bacterium]|nr:MAG: hypothetical protein KatS3mg124_0516 [Porticoccaceae bacterium]
MASRTGRGWSGYCPTCAGTGALAEGELAALERQVYAALLRRRCREARALPAAERAEAVRALDRFWARLPARLRREPELVLAWLDALAALGRPERAARRMARFLARRWDGRLAARYAALPGGDSLKRVKQLEGWLAEHPDDPDLLEALAALCARCELWGKARDYYERALALRPAPATWLALGRLLEARGEAQAACERYREGLRAAVES